MSIERIKKSEDELINGSMFLDKRVSNSLLSKSVKPLDFSLAKMAQIR